MPPLLNCIHNLSDETVDDSYTYDEYLDILEIMLQHPKCNVNILQQGMRRTVLNLACGQMKSARAIKLLLEHKDIDIGITDVYGETALHLLMKKIEPTNMKIATAALKQFINHPKIANSICKLNNFGLSVIDVFLQRQDIHSYDLEISKSFQNILRIILTFDNVSAASGKSLAIAGTLCSPSVFKMIIDNGARTSDSLAGETSLHCVVSRNSVAKCRFILEKDPDLYIKWNNCNAFEMSQNY